MLTLLLYLVVGLAAIYVFLVGAFVITLNKMVTDEMRARLDAIPAVLVALALRLAPADQRQFLRVDWMDNLLVAFDEKNARYPVTRIFLSLPFALPLFGTATRLRRQARASHLAWPAAGPLERVPRVPNDLAIDLRAGEELRVSATYADWLGVTDSATFTIVRRGADGGRDVDTVFVDDRYL